jgi:hypothetical protein
MPDFELLRELIAEIQETVGTMLDGMDNYGDVIERANLKWTDFQVQGDYMMILSAFVTTGNREVDTIGVTGFAVPHDGQLTVCVNHMGGIKVHDNAEGMFPNG